MFQEKFFFLRMVKFLIIKTQRVYIKAREESSCSERVKKVSVRASCIFIWIQSGALWWGLHFLRCSQSEGFWIHPKVLVCCCIKYQSSRVRQLSFARKFPFKVKEAGGYECMNICYIYTCKRTHTRLCAPPLLRRLHFSFPFCCCPHASLPGLFLQLLLWY